MSWLIDREYDIQSSSNEVSYVNDCVKRTKIPAKFHPILEPLGIIFNLQHLDYGECHAECTLPSGWSLRGEGDTLFVVNNQQEDIFSASVTDHRGYRKWTQNDI